MILNAFGQPYSAAQQNYNRNIPSASEMEYSVLSDGDQYYQIVRNAKNLMRNNWIARAITAVYVRYVCSGGFPVSGSTEESLKIWNRFKVSVDEKGVSTLDEFMRQLVSILTLTDALLISRVTKGRVNYQLIDGSRVKTPPKLKESSNIKLGIKYDSNGAEVGYYVIKEDSANSAYLGDDDNYEYIPRFTKTGRFSSLLVRRPSETLPSQLRTLPLIVAGIPEIHDIGNLSDAAVKVANTLSRISLIGKTSKPGLARDVFNGSAPGGYSELKPGAINLMPHEFDFEAFEHKGSADLVALTKESVMHVLAPTGIPYEIFYSTFAGANFSSAKMDYDAFMRAIDGVVDKCLNVLQLMYRQVISFYSFAGGKNTTSEDYEVVFARPMPPDPDPSKTAGAVEKNLKNHITSPEREAVRLGYPSYRVYLESIKRSEDLQLEILGRKLVSPDEVILSASVDPEEIEDDD